MGCIGGNEGSNWVVRACQVLLLVLLKVCGLSRAQVKEVTRAMIEEPFHGESERWVFPKIECELKGAEEKDVSFYGIKDLTHDEVEYMVEESRVNEKLEPLEEERGRKVHPLGHDVEVDSLSYFEEEIREKGKSVLVVAFRRVLEDGGEMEGLKHLYEKQNEAYSFPATLSNISCTNCGAPVPNIRRSPALNELTTPHDIQKVKEILTGLDKACKELVRLVVKMRLVQYNLVGKEGARCFTKDGACMFSLEVVAQKEGDLPNPPFVQNIKPHFFPTLHPHIASRAKHLKRPLKRTRVEDGRN